MSLQHRYRSTQPQHDDLCHLKDNTTFLFDENGSNSDSALNASKLRQPERKSLQHSLLLSRRLVLGCLFVTSILAALIVVRSSRRFTIFNVDLSSLLHRYLEIRGGPCESEWYHQDCVFDLCKPAHEGSDAKLYRGTCPIDGGDVRVLLKSMKKPTSIVKSAAYMEAKVTRVMETYPGSELKVVDSGLNYIILTEFVGFRTLDLPDLIRRKGPDIMETVIQQVMSQLKWLHRGGYFHLDVDERNILQDELGSNFVLIDISRSRPTSEWKAVLRDNLRGFEGRYRKHPELPMLVCLLPGQSKQEREYCRHHDANASVCPAFVDAYKLGVATMRVYYQHAFNRGVEVIPSSSFENIVRQRTIDLDAFHSLQDKYGDTKALSLISQLVNNLNTSWVCE
jgi:hypothetical protein